MKVRVTYELDVDGETSLKDVQTAAYDGAHEVAAAIDSAASRPASVRRVQVRVPVERRGA